jgi:UDP-3-O-[3-hydroxymyristoyl] glucosamine N-acyltransferase
MAHSLGEIAALVQGQLTGDESLLIRGVNDLSRAEGDQLSFLGNPRYIKQAYQSKAGAILVPTQATGAFSSALIRVPNPSVAFAQIAALFTPPPLTWAPGIHPSAVIAESARIGEKVCIGPHVTVEPDAVIAEGVHLGAGCYIGHECHVGEGSFFYPNVTVRERCQIGKRVILHAGVVIGSDGFGYEFQQGRYEKVPQTGYVQLDDDVEVGANSTIDRGRFDKTWIKQGTKIDNLVIVAHNVVVGEHSILVAQAGIAGSATLGNYNTVGGQAAIVGHVKIADKVSITGWTAVTKDIKEPGVYRGGPAKPMRESMEIEALTQRLPELYDRLKALEKAASLK